MPPPWDAREASSVKGGILILVALRFPCLGDVLRQIRLAAQVLCVDGSPAHRVGAWPRVDVVGDGRARELPVRVVVEVPLEHLARVALRVRRL